MLSDTIADGTIVSRTIPLYVGHLLTSVAATETSGEVQNETVDIDSLPSGGYSIWIEAEGASGGTIRCYIRYDGNCDPNATDAQIYYVTHHSFFDGRAAWLPEVVPAFAIQDGQLTVSWVAATHPDIDGYTAELTINGTVTETVRVAQNRSGEVVQATFNNIEPGQAYQVRVAVRDDDRNLIIWSPQHDLAAPQPGFIVSADALLRRDAEITLVAGSTTEAPLSIDLSSNMRHGVVLSVDYEQLPDGLYVTLPDTFVARNTRSRAMDATISASSTVQAGHYIIPIRAESGAMVKMLNLPITVTEQPVLSMVTLQQVETTQEGIQLNFVILAGLLLLLLSNIVLRRQR